MYSLTRPLQRAYSLPIIQIVGASLFIALCAQISVYLPFSPVPITGQTLAVLMVGSSLGSRKGLLAVAAYIAEGMMGLPVFAGGAISPLAFVGPTGGYITGMLAQAFLIGWFLERKDSPNWLNLIIGCVLAVTVQMAMGVLWLSHFVGWNHVMAMGLIPFIPGELVKIAVVCLCLNRSNAHEQN